MDPREFPTKGNLMLAKNSLALARQGYDLMDKKRNVLLKELMALIDEAKEIQEQIDTSPIYQEKGMVTRGIFLNKQKRLGGYQDKQETRQDISVNVTFGDGVDASDFK